MPLASRRASASLKNELKPVAEWQQGRAALESPAEVAGEPIERFIILPAPPPGIAPPDKALAFTATPLAVAGAPGNEKCSLRRVPSGWNGEGAPVVLAANSRFVRRADAATDKAAIGTQAPAGNAPIALPFPGGAAVAPPSLPNLQPLDWSYDFLTDFVLSGRAGDCLAGQRRLVPRCHGADHAVRCHHQSVLLGRVARRHRIGWRPRHRAGKPQRPAARAAAQQPRRQPEQ